MDPITLAFIGATAFKAIAGWFSGRSAQRVANQNADSVQTIANLNANYIDEATAANAGIDDFNADSLHAQAVDATARGRETEGRFRTEVKGMIGTQKAGYAGQGVEVGSGSALDVQKDTAYQGELDALTLRTNAAREAWGYDVAAKGQRKGAEATRKLGGIQAANTRTTGRLNAASIRAGGNAARTDANWQVAGTILTGGMQAAKMQQQANT